MSHKVTHSSSINISKNPIVQLNKTFSLSYLNNSHKTLLSIIIEMLNNKLFYKDILATSHVLNLFNILLNIPNKTLVNALEFVIKIELEKPATIIFRDSSFLNQTLNKILYHQPYINFNKKSIKQILKASDNKRTYTLVKEIHKHLQFSSPPKNTSLILQLIKKYSSIEQMLVFLYLRIINPNLVGIFCKDNLIYINMIKELQEIVNNIFNNGIVNYLDNKLYVKVYNTVKYIPSNDDSFEYFTENIDDDIKEFLSYLIDKIETYTFISKETKLLIKNHCFRMAISYF